MPRGGTSWVVARRFGECVARLSTLVARVLREAGMRTLLIDLLFASEEDLVDTRFGIAPLTRRLLGAFRSWMVGGHDDVGIGLNRQPYDELACEKKLVVIPGACHLFEEPGALDEVAREASAWFGRHLTLEPRR